MSVSPDYYRYTWIESGVVANDTTMEALQVCEAEQEVVWAVTPLVEKKSTEEVLEWQVASPSKVLTRPKETSKKSKA